MTQPKFAPIQSEDQVRGAYRLQTPHPWVADRPADFRAGDVPHGRGFGTPGPDQGYILHLVELFADRLKLRPDESLEDVAQVCAAIALRRAALFGRAPVSIDLTLAFTLTGCLGDPPDDLVNWRSETFKGMSHHYWELREIAERVAESTLCLTPAQAGERTNEWRALLGVDAARPAAHPVPVAS